MCTCHTCQTKLRGQSYPCIIIHESMAQSCCGSRIIKIALWWVPYACATEMTKWWLLDEMSKHFSETSSLVRYNAPGTHVWIAFIRESVSCRGWKLTFESALFIKAMKQNFRINLFSNNLNGYCLFPVVLHSANFLPCSHSQHLSYYSLFPISPVP